MKIHENGLQFVFEFQHRNLLCTQNKELEEI